MKTVLPLTTFLRFATLSVLLLAAGPLARGADYIKNNQLNGADGGFFLNDFQSWLSNGVATTLPPTNTDRVIWDATVATAANATNTLNFTPSIWGSLWISNAAATVNITNDTAVDRILNLVTVPGNTNSIVVSNRDFIIGTSLVVQSNAQAWTIAPGRLLTLATGRTLTINRSLFISGNVRSERQMNIQSNATVTIAPNSLLDSETNQVSQLRIGTGTLTAGGGHVVQNASTVIVARVSAGTSFQMGTGTNTATTNLSGFVNSTPGATNVTYTLNGGLLDVAAGPLSNSTAFIGFTNTSRGTFTINSNGVFRANALSISTGDFYSTNSVVINDNGLMTVASVTAASASNSAVNITLSSNGILDVVGALALANGSTGSVATVVLNNNAIIRANSAVIGTRRTNNLVTLNSNAQFVVTNDFQMAGAASSEGSTANGSLYMTLNNSSRLTVGRITRGLGFPTNAAFLNFNGGTLAALSNNLNLVSNTVYMMVSNSGAVIDTAAFIVTNSAPMRHATNGATVDGGLVKLGAGRLVLTATNNYNGPTIISNGTLVINSVYSNSATGGGGPILVRDGATLNVRQANTNATLFATNLTLGASSGANLVIDVQGNRTNILLPIIRATNLVTAGSVSLSITNTGLGLPIGTYTIIDYNGSIGGAGFGAFTLTLPPGFEGNLVNNIGNSSVDLDITGVPKDLRWEGQVNADWNINGDQNWIDLIDNATPSVYKNGYTVVFDDNAAGPGGRAITLNTTVVPGVTNVMVNNSGADYSFTGTGRIDGAATFSKRGTGLFIMATGTNDYLGSTYILDGTYRLGASEVIPHGVGRGNLILGDGIAVPVLDLNGKNESINGINMTNAIIENSSATSVVFGINTNGTAGNMYGVVQNTGGGPIAIWKSGAGTLNMTNGSTFTGGFRMDAGTVNTPDGSAFGPTNNWLALGGTLNITNGSLTNYQGITNTANLTITIFPNNTLFFGGNTWLPTNGHPHGFTLDVNSNGNFVLSNTVGLMSNISYQGGTLVWKDVNITNTGVFRVGRSASNPIVNALFDNVRLVTTNISGATRYDIGEHTNSIVTWEITNNSQLFVNQLFVAKSNNSSATVNMRSGLLTNVHATGDWRIGGSAVGHTNSTGVFNLIGGSVDVLANLQIGYTGTGVVNITGGSMNSWSNTPVIGRLTNTTANGVGILNVSAGSFNARSSSNNLIIGEQGDGFVNVTNTGSVTAAGFVIMGRSNAAVANQFTSSGTLILGTGGSFTAPRITGSNGHSTIIFAGGTLVASSSTNVFLQGIKNTNGTPQAFVRAEGGIIDTGTNRILITQSFTPAVGSPLGGLTKIGTGNLTLGGSNSYTGPTVVSAGKLFINSTFSNTGPSTINVSNTAGFGVRRTIGDAIATTPTVNLGTGGASTLDFDLGNFGNPTTNVAFVPAFTANGTVTVNLSGGNLANGTIRLLAYSGSSGPGSFSLGTLPQGVSGYVSNDTVNSVLNFTVTDVEQLKWNGLVNSQWDDITTNWTLGGDPSFYIDFASAPVFDDTVLGTTTVTPAFDVSPVSILVSNVLSNYTFIGTNRIIGAASLTKTGAGVFTLAIRSNTYTGPTVINGGTLALGTNRALPNAAGTTNVLIAGGATLNLNGFDESVTGVQGLGTINNSSATDLSTIWIGTNGGTGDFPGTITSGAGGLIVVKTGTSNFTFSGANTFSGATYVQQGRLRISSSNAVSTGPVILGQAMFGPSAGAIILTNSILGTNTGNSVFDTGGGDLTLTGPVNFNGPELAKTNTGTLTFAPSSVVNLDPSAGFDVYGGSVVVNGAAVTLQNDGFRLRATTNAPNVDVTLLSGSTLTLSGASQLILGNTADTNLPIVTPIFTNTFNLSAGASLLMSNGGVFVGNNNANAGVFNQNGGTVTFSSTNNAGLSVSGGSTNVLGIYNLNGGTLSTPRVFKGGTGTSVGRFNFAGGTLAVLNSTRATTFFTGLDSATFSSTGGIIDTGTNIVVINQSFSENTNSIGGGLTKLGTGTIVMGGSTNTYTNDTLVNFGSLMVNFPYAGQSHIKAADGAGFGARRTNLTNPPPTVTNVTVGVSTGGSMTFDLGTLGNSSNAAVNVSNLMLNGAIAVNITGGNLSTGTVKLVDYMVLSGTHTLSLGTVARGLVVNLVTNLVDTSIDLNITAINPVLWTGGTDTNWDIGTTLNWVTNATPTTYQDTDYILFPESAPLKTVFLTTNVVPSSITVSNVAAYTFNASTNADGSSNRITGAASFIKDGSGEMTLAAPLDTTGFTRILAGTLKLGANDMLPDGGGRSNLIIAGTLDLNGRSDTVSAVDLNASGVINNSSITNSILTVGANNGAVTFSGLVQDTAGDLLIVKTGTATNTFATANTWSGGLLLNVGRVAVGTNQALGVGPVTMNTNTTLATLTNLTLANLFQGTNLGGTATFNNDGGDLNLTGGFNWDGPAIAMTGTNTTRLSGGAMTLGTNSEVGAFGRLLIVDGISMVHSNDGFRLRATTNLSTVTVILTNNPTLGFKDSANFVAGATSDTNAVVLVTNLLRMESGTVTFSNNTGGVFVGSGVGNSGTFTQNGGTITFLDGGNGNGVGLCNNTNTAGTYALNGGTLTVSRVRKITAGTSTVATFIFNGGTLKSFGSLNAGGFMQGLDSALISSGGAIIDVDTNAVTINQPLSENTNSTGGTLTKLGGSNLTLTATNTYPGATLVSNGRLLLTPTYVGPSPITVANGAILAHNRAVPHATATAANVTLNLGSTLELGLNGYGNSGVPVLNVSNLTVAGAATVNVTGSGFTPGTFPLVKYTNLTGFGSLTLAPLPQGVIGSLNNNVGTSTIELVISTVTQLTWTGASNQVWNLNSTNWQFNAVGVLYSNGLETLFDDSLLSNSAVVLIQNVSPASVTINNPTTNYSFLGTNFGIQGAGGLTKTGAGQVTMGLANTYTGRTSLEAGTFLLATNEVIPNTGTSPNTILTNSAILDLNGFTETLRGLEGNGTVNNSSSLTTSSNTTLVIGTPIAQPATFTGIIQDTGSNILVIKTNTGTNVLTGVNTYEGGTWLRQGGLIIGNNSSLGSGPLTIAQAATLGTTNGARALTMNITGFTNAGSFNFLTDGGNLTLTGSLATTNVTINKLGLNELRFGSPSVVNIGNAEFGLRGGSLVIDGASVTASNGFRTYGTTNDTLLTTVVTNSGSLIIPPDGTNPNLLLGRNDLLNTPTPVATNLFFLASGTVSVGGAFNMPNNIGNVAEFTQNGGVVTFGNLTNNAGLVLAGASNSVGVYRLNAGSLTTSRITQGDTNNTTANFIFGGGTLIALNNSNAATFMQGLDQALIRNSGANIDTGTNTVTINQSLLEDPTSIGGGLSKLGLGSLTLGGTNTYTNVTAVSAGKLFISPGYVGSSVINVANNAGFGVRRDATGNTAFAGTVTLAGAANTLDFDLGDFGSTPANAVGRVTNFNAAGSTVTVNVSGLNFTPGAVITLLDYDGSSGGPTLVVGSLPVGVTASVANNLGTTAIELTIIAVDRVIWNGNVNDRWDNVSLNWLFQSNPYVFTNGHEVLFRDSPVASTVFLTNDVAPASILVSNNATAYTFAPTTNQSNQITGTGRLNKMGSGVFTLGFTNNSSGQVTVSGGTLRLGTNEVLRHATGTPNLNVTNTGVFDLNGRTETLTGIEGNGTIDNSSASNATLIVGTNAGSSLFSGTITDTGALLLKKSGTGTNILTGNNSTWGGGTLIDNGFLLAGHNNALGTGPITLDDGGSLGTFGGSRTITNSILSSTAGGEVNINTDGGDITLTGPVNITNPDLNKEGTNTLTFASSAIVTLGANVELGVNNGSVVVDGATMTVTNDGFRVRASTNAPFVTATVQNSSVITLAGTANVSIGTTGNTNVVGPALSNVFTLTSGAITVSNGGIFVANGIGNGAAIIQNGGTFGFNTPTNTNGVFLAGNTNTHGVYHLNGGTLTTPRVARTGSNDTFASFRFNGGTLKALNAVFSNDFVQNLSEVLVRAGGATIDTDTFTIAINQGLLNDGASPGGGLVKVGAGTLRLNGTNTYTGTTVVTAGTLGGTGTYAGSVTVSATGTIAPGSSIGTMTIASNLSLAGTTVMEINRTSIPNADLLAAGGAVTFGGTLTVTNTGAALQGGDTFNLFDGLSFGGTFSATNLPALTGGLVWDLSQLAVNGTITVVAPVTSPAIITDVAYGPGNTNVQLTGINGQPSATYRVFTEIDMTVPYTNWLPIATNTFDGSGNFIINFPVTPSDARRFYYIRFP